MLEHRKKLISRQNRTLSKSGKQATEFLAPGGRDLPQGVPAVEEVEVDRDKILDLARRVSRVGEKQASARP
jgi:hypothetical protein